MLIGFFLISRVKMALSPSSVLLVNSSPSQHALNTPVSSFTPYSIERPATVVFTSVSPLLNSDTRSWLSSLRPPPRCASPAHPPTPCSVHTGDGPDTPHA